MKIDIASSDEQILACYPVMRELRPHIAEADFLPQVRRQQQGGYQLACLQTAQGIVALAGFRIGENLAWGRFLYVDDLVTLSTQRSSGHGARLLTWLRAHAIGEGCDQLHLDSGLQREEAHRFYLREGMSKASLHFSLDLTG